MKSSYLLPYALKQIGAYLFLPAVILALYTLYAEPEPAWLDFTVLHFAPQNSILPLDQEKKSAPLFLLQENNWANEIAGLLLFLSCVFLVFGRERDEDEFVMRLRLESLLRAFQVYSILLFLGLVFTYDFTFLQVMIYNLFLPFIIFIIRFHWVLYQHRKAVHS